MAWTAEQGNAYLDANPDVRAAVMQGQFSSPEQHFQLHGHGENRAGVPGGSPQTPQPQVYERYDSMGGGAFGGTSPVAPKPMDGGRAPGAFGTIQPIGSLPPGYEKGLPQSLWDVSNQRWRIEDAGPGLRSSPIPGGLNSQFGDTGMTIGQYAGQNPVIAQGLASGALDASDFQQTGFGSFTTSPRVAELERQAMIGQQHGMIEDRLRAMDSRYDQWKTATDPRSQNALASLKQRAAADGWTYDQMFSPQAQYNQWAQTQQPQANGQLPAAPGLFGGSGFQGAQNYQPQGRQTMQPQGGGFAGMNYGMYGNPIPRGQGVYSSIRPQTGAFGGSQFGSFQRQPGQNMQPMFDAMGRGGQGASPTGQFQGGFMGFNQQQPSQGAFGGNQTGFLR